MMTPDVLGDLGKQELTPFHQKMLDHCKRLVKISRSKMSRMYGDWDHQDQVFRGEIVPDKDDRKQEEAGKPIKMVVPNTFAQCMTFTSFLFLMFKQNETFYELNPTGDEDSGKKHSDCELVLERDLRKNHFNTSLFQHLIDIPRFGVGALDCSWTKQYANAYVESEPVQFSNPLTGSPIDLTGGGGWQKFLKYEGNLIRPVSPYRIFPDLRRPITEYQRGEFCAYEEPYSMGQLRTMESNGEVQGVDYIQPLAKNFDEDRGGSTRVELASDNTAFIRNVKFDVGDSTHNALVTKVQIKIVPKKFTVNDKPLGDEEFEVMYNCWYANDNRLIKCERANWWHGLFTLNIAQFTPDMHRTINLGLADLIYRLQDVISWFMNSHISSVRRVIANRLIIDPRIIDTDTLDGEGDIYLRRGVSVPDLKRAVGQLDARDVTAGHMGDVDMISKIIEQVTGVNNNAMGQYNSGRRSAQEARVVTAGAAGRMKLHAHLIWEASLGQMGEMMLSNSRQSLSLESFQRVVGNGATDPTTGQNDLMERFAAFKGTPGEVIGGDDFMQFDSTLSSEKGFMAQAIQELLSVVFQANPAAAMQFTSRVDPLKMVTEMFSLRGAGSVSRFNYDPGMAPPIMQPQVLPQPVPPVASATGT